MGTERRPHVAEGDGAGGVVVLVPLGDAGGEVVGDAVVLRLPRVPCPHRARSGSLSSHLHPWEPWRASQVRPSSSQRSTAMPEQKSPSAAAPPHMRIRSRASPSPFTHFSPVSSARFGEVGFASGRGRAWAEEGVVFGFILEQCRVLQQL